MPPRTRSAAAPSSSNGTGNGNGSTSRSRGRPPIKRENGEEEGVSEEGMYLLPFMTPLYVLSALLVALGAGLAHHIRHGPFRPVVWESPPPLAELKGLILQPNFDLAGAEHLFLNQVVGPESIAMGRDDHEIFLSLNDGRVVRTDSNYGGMTTVFFTGGVIKAEAAAVAAEEEEEKGLPNGSTEVDLMQWCSAEMQAMRFSTETETICGRPLGMRFMPASNLLYIADAYHGIFTLDTWTLQVRHLVKPEAPTTIIDKDKYHAGISKPLRFTNDMDIVPETGDIIFTDSTWAWSRAEHAVDISDGAPRGRLFRYVAETGAVEPIMCGLHFANGVQLLGELGETTSGLPHYALVVESTRFRILRVDLWAWHHAPDEEKAAALAKCDEDNFLPFPSFVETFVEGLPGLPDNIRLQTGPSPLGKKDVLLIGMGAKNTQPFALLQFLYQHRVLRHILTALIPLKAFHTLMPKYGLVGVLSSQDGKLLRVLQDPTGRTPFVSEAHLHPRTGDLLLGSFRNRFLGKVTLSSLV